MKRPVIIAAVTAVVALAIVAFAISAAGSDGKDPEIRTPAPTDSAGGGSVGGEEPSPGPDTPVDDEQPGDSETPIPTEPMVPVTPVDPGNNPQLPADRQAEPAPIDGLDVLVLESFPPQYMLNVQAGLPSGCAEQYMHEVSRDGDVITVTVLNSLPKGTDVVCTAIYGMYELNINLGSDFEPGETYTVRVNGQETSFTAQ